MVSSMLIGNIAWELKEMIRISESAQHSLAVDLIFQTLQYDNKKVVSQTCKLSNIYVGKARIMSVSTHFARDA